MRIEAATEATQELLDALTSLLPQLNPKLEPLTMERLIAVIDDPATTLLVARDGESIVGAAAVIVYATPAFCQGAHRRRGRGRAFARQRRGRGAGHADA